MVARDAAGVLEREGRGGEARDELGERGREWELARPSGGRGGGRIAAVGCLLIVSLVSLDSEIIVVVERYVNGAQRARHRTRTRMTRLRVSLQCGGGGEVSLDDAVIHVIMIVAVVVSVCV